MARTRRLREELRGVDRFWYSPHSSAAPRDAGTTTRLPKVPVHADCPAVHQRAYLDDARVPGLALRGQCRPPRLSAARWSTRCRARPRRIADVALRPAFARIRRSNHRTVDTGSVRRRQVQPRPDWNCAEVDRRRVHKAACETPVNWRAPPVPAKSTRAPFVFCPTLMMRDTRVLAGRPRSLPFVIWFATFVRLPSSVVVRACRARRSSLCSRSTR